MNQTPNKHSFNVLLNPSEEAMLTELARLEGTSRGAILRKLINNLFTMRREGQPVCANGQGCFVPHMHPRPSLPPDPPRNGHHAPG